VTTASFSRFGSAQFGGSQSHGFEGNSFARNGFGRQGYGHGDNGHSGYGYGRGGWHGRGWHGGGWHGGGWYGGGYGGNDFWFLGDLFGLALNFSSLALNPWAPVGLAGWNLLDTGIQALSSLDNNDQSFENNDQQSSYNPPLCGTYDSEENPGCMQ
jgi:hypothetical protein